MQCFSKKKFGLYILLKIRSKQVSLLCVRSTEQKKKTRLFILNQIPAC